MNEAIKNFIFLILSGLPTFCSGQMTIDNASNTITQLVDGILVPSGSSTTVSNVTFRGVVNVSGRYQIGYFSTAGTTASEMGLANGIILSTGNTADVPLTPGTDPGTVAQMSRNYVSGTSGEIRSSNAPAGQDTDADVLLSPYNYYNAAILEFDFVPNSSHVEFNYLFASEEYDQEDGAMSINYNCSAYNDKFAFLLSGPGITGGQGYSNDAVNIARLANNAEVGINSVNNGVVGSYGGSPDASNCQAANGAWTNGSPTTEFLGKIDGTELNGNTEVLTAFYDGLTSGQTYHIRIVIADASDGAYDSVVYLEGLSFSTEPTVLPVGLIDFKGNCDSGDILLEWQTNSEINNDYFLVEKADETMNFRSISEISGNGTVSTESKYSYVDNMPFTGTNYYRLSQIDFNGVKTSLKTIAVENACNTIYGDVHIQLDVRNDKILLDFKSNEEFDFDVMVIDQTGQVVLSDKLHKKRNEKNCEFSFPKSLSTGMYFVNIKTIDGSKTVKLYLN